MRLILGFLAALVIINPASAAGLNSISNAEAASGLKQALADGSAAAVAQLGVQDGFFANPKVKIPLPPALQRVEAALRFAGMRKQADDLVLTMNRAAEAAVPEAKALLVDSVKRMSVQDAKGILTGGDTAATEYFRRTTQAQLTKRFLPIVKQQTEVGVDIPSDGECSKINFAGYVSDRLSGFEQRETPRGESPIGNFGRDHKAFPEFYAEYSSLWRHVLDLRFEGGAQVSGRVGPVAARSTMRNIVRSRFRDPASWSLAWARNTVCAAASPRSSCRTAR